MSNDDVFANVLLTSVASGDAARRDSSVSEHLATAGGFTSEHFSEGRIRTVIGECRTSPLTDIASIVTF
jgi:hypothetical protein